MSQEKNTFPEMNQLYQRLVECSPNVLSVHALSGEMVFVSRGCVELVGYEPEDLGSMDFWTLIHPDDRHIVEGMFKAIPESASLVAVPYRVRHAKGYMVWIESTGRLMKRHHPEEQVLIQISSRNVTAKKLLNQQRDKMSTLLDALSIQLQERMEELRSTEKQLVQAQKLEAIGQLAGGIAHDFNNLLGGVIGFSEAIELEARSHPSIAEKASRIQQAATRGMELTRKILTFARVNSGRRTSESFNEIIKEAVALLERSLPKVIVIELELAKDLWCVSCDRSEMIQVLLNLGINAKDAMPHGGKIRIRTQNSDNSGSRQILIEFSDTGQGIPLEIQDRVFEPFFTTKDVGKGTGLGLSMVYGIVQSHEGLIRVSSTLDQGASFAIALPVAIEEHDSQSGPSGPSYSVPVGRHTASFGGRTALVIDDHDDVRELGEDYLAEVGFNLLSAADGSEALNLFHEHVDRIDIIILDMNLPEKSGRHVFAEIRGQRPNLPILIFSGFAREDALEVFKGDEYVSVLEKPCTQDEYLEAVRNALAPSLELQN